MAESGLKSCCFGGFRWGGTPTGREEEIGGSSVYVSGTNSQRGILVFPQGSGWKDNNIRLLADHFAEEVEATTYVVDVFKGAEVEYNPKTDGKFEEHAAKHPEILSRFAERNTKEIRRDQLFAVAKALRAKYAKFGIVGYCYGGWISFQLAAEKGLVDCITVAHPAMLTKEELDGVQVPVQFHAPQYDPMFSPDLHAHVLETYPKRADLQWSWNYYPGMAHGFAGAGDPRQENAKKSLELAKSLTAAWLRRWL